VGVIYGCHVFVPRFKRQGSGHVLNIASLAGLISAPEMAPYNVTKAGVVALSETLFGELAPLGIGGHGGVPVVLRQRHRQHPAASAARTRA
jgi:short-subunit dehydrogenase